MNRRFAIASVTAGCLWVACAGGPPPAVSPSGPDLTAFAFAPTPVRYRTVSVRNNVTSAMGQATTLNSRLDFTTRVSVSTAGEDREIEIVVDSVIRVEGQMLLAGSRREATGATLRGRIAQDGQLTNMELEPIRLADDPIIGQISAAYQQYFPRVPARGVAPGTVWTDTTTITRDQSGAEIVLEAVTEFKAGFWSDTTTRAELAVEWSRDYEVSGAGEQMGQEFTVSGTGHSQGIHRFRADGQYLGSFMSDSSSSNINVISLGLTVPLAQTGVDSVTIVP